MCSVAHKVAAHSETTSCAHDQTAHYSPPYNNLVKHANYEESLKLKPWSEWRWQRSVGKLERAASVMLNLPSAGEKEEVDLVEEEVAGYHLYRLPYHFTTL